MDEEKEEEEEEEEEEEKEEEEEEEEDEYDEEEGEENGESEAQATASEVDEPKPPTKKEPTGIKTPAPTLYTIGFDEETKADVVSDINVKAPKPINEHISFKCCISKLHSLSA